MSWLKWLFGNKNKPESVPEKTAFEKMLAEQNNERNNEIPKKIAREIMDDKEKIFNIEYSRWYDDHSIKFTYGLDDHGLECVVGYESKENRYILYYDGRHYYGSFPEFKELFTLLFSKYVPPERKSLERLLSAKNDTRKDGAK